MVAHVKGEEMPWKKEGKSLVLVVLEVVGSDFGNMDDVGRCWMTGGGFKYVLFSPLFGEMIHFD